MNISNFDEATGNELEVARTRLGEAEDAVETAQREWKAAKRRRREAKEAARRAKKRLRRVKEELARAEVIKAEDFLNISDILCCWHSQLHLQSRIIQK
jgi:sRNA-binding protein